MLLHFLMKYDDIRITIKFKEMGPSLSVFNFKSQFSKLQESMDNWFVFLDYKRQAAPVVEKYLVPCLSKKSFVL